MQLSVDNLIMPFFVVEGKNIKKPIKNFPGVFHLSVDKMLKDIDEIEKLGIHTVLLFGVTNKKDDVGSFAWNKNGVVQNAVKKIKQKYSEVVVMTDVCLCGYKSDGHCGIFRNKKLNINSTLKYLSKIALSHAEAGSDFVAPSAMMDGQVKSIRNILNKNGFSDVGILAYSAKFASNFYGPFREALDSSPKFGDRKSYQLDYANTSDALKKIERDIDDGADIIMVKPALCYLDIIKGAKKRILCQVQTLFVSDSFCGLALNCYLILPVLSLY